MPRNPLYWVVTDSMKSPPGFFLFERNYTEEDWVVVLKNVVKGCGVEALQCEEARNRYTLWKLMQ